MNRCITCGKIVTSLKARNMVEHDGHSYLVCCPMCEKEFNRDADHYVGVAQTLFGDYAVKAHSQATDYSSGSKHKIENHSGNVHMIRNMKEAFNIILTNYKDLYRHFELISTASGLEDLRKSLKEHHVMMESLQEQLNIQAGVCRFILSVEENSQNMYTN